MLFMLSFPFTAILLLKKQIIPVEYNSLVLLAAFVIALIQVRYYIRKKIWRSDEIGCDLKNIKDGWQWYLLLICTGIILFMCAGFVIRVRTDISLVKLFSSALLCACMQQLLFSVWLIQTIKDALRNPYWVCAIVIIFFIYAHTFFAHPERVLPASALFGLMITPLYNSHPNYPLASVTHWIWNALSIYIYLFSPIWG